MKKATVAKKSGQSTPSSAVEGRPRRASSGGAASPSASSRAAALTRVADERHVRVLERRLARRDAADAGAVEPAEHGVRELGARLRLHDEQLRLVALLDRRRRARPRARARARRDSSGDAVDLDLDDAALGDPRLQLARRALGDDLALARSRRCGRRAASASNM